jgi:hypothetical protein
MALSKGRKEYPKNIFGVGGTCHGLPVDKPIVIVGTMRRDAKSKLERPTAADAPRGEATTNTVEQVIAGANDLYSTLATTTKEVMGPVTLTWRYHVGRHVATLMSGSRQDRYGKELVANLGTRLQGDGRPAASRASLYQFASFYADCEACGGVEMITFLEEHGASYNIARRICCQKTSLKELRKLVRNYQSINARAILELLEQFPKPTASASIEWLAHTVKLMTDAESALGRAGQQANHFRALPPDARDGSKALVSELRTAMGRLKDRIRIANEDWKSVIRTKKKRGLVRVVSPLIPGRA